MPARGRRDPTAQAVRPHGRRRRKPAVPSGPTRTASGRYCRRTGGIENLVSPLNPAQRLSNAGLARAQGTCCAAGPQRSHHQEGRSPGFAQGAHLPLRGQRRNFTCFPILRDIDRRGTFERSDYIVSAGCFPSARRRRAELVRMSFVRCCVIQITCRRRGLLYSAVCLRAVRRGEHPGTKS